MLNADLLMEFLADIQPSRYCDDCLSDFLKITPRQQINQLCRGLAGQHRLRRQAGICDSCGRAKKVNSLESDGTGRSSPAEGTEKPATSASVPVSVEPVDIEKLRMEVVRICHKVWQDHKNEAPPHSISIVINDLKNEQLIPAHQANMMLTLCGLRNVFVYDRMPINKKEANVALNAWGIIADWWERAIEKSEKDT